MKRKISIILVLVLMLSTIFCVNVFALTKATIKNGTYTIQSKLGKNMVMDVYNASKESGANIQLYKSNGSAAQQFEIKKSGSYYTITPKCSGLKVDVRGGSKEAGANVWQYTSNNTDSQKWLFYEAGDGYYYLRCKVGDKALDVSGGKSSNGTNIQMWDLNYSDAQKWKLIPIKSSKKLSDIAKAEIGVSGKNDYSIYGEFTGSNPAPWCASFVSWCANKVGISTRIIPKTASCDVMKNNSNSYVKWSNNALKKIKKNDVVFFAPGMQGSDSNHVGIVCSVSGNKVTIIEGNTSNDKVEKRTYTVINKKARNGEVFGRVGYWNGGYNYFCGYISVN